MNRIQDRTTGENGFVVGVGEEFAAAICFAVLCTSSIHEKNARFSLLFNYQEINNENCPYETLPRDSHVRLASFAQPHKRAAPSNFTDMAR